MRDGVRLFTSIHFPKGEGRFPAIVVRNLYRAAGAVAESSPFDDLPVCYVEQDVRGSGASEGEWYPWLQEIEDGEDCLKWLAAQPWCNGRIAMTGGSYLGAAQWFAASCSPKGLVAISPAICPLTYDETPKRRNGLVNLKLFIDWGLGVCNQNLPPERRVTLKGDELAWHLPLSEIDEAAGLGKVGFWKDWLTMTPRSALWRKMSLKTIIPNVPCPAYIQSGWFDIHVKGVLEGFMAMRRDAPTQEGRAFTRCVIGPWTHGQDLGELPRGDDFSLETHYYIPLRRFLMGLLQNPQADPLPNEPPLKYFMFGSNTWMSADSWPPPEARERLLFLHSGGAANTLHGDGSLSWEPPKGDEKPDAYVYDPANPVPTNGGHSICCVSGSHDQRKVEERQDVLVYTTAPLTEDVTIAGRLSLILHAATSATDTDFIAQLIDVFPDGRAFNLADGVLRVSYRHESDGVAPEPVVPNEPISYTIDMWSIANCFKAGHRIRLEVTSSNFPQFDRNLNSGSDREIRTARQQIFHDATRLSCLRLPVLP